MISSSVHECIHEGKASSRSENSLKDWLLVNMKAVAQQILTRYGVLDRVLAAAVRKSIYVALCGVLPHVDEQYRTLSNLSPGSTQLLPYNTAADRLSDLMVELFGTEHSDLLAADLDTAEAQGISSEAMKDPALQLTVSKLFAAVSMFLIAEADMLRRGVGHLPDDVSSTVVLSIERVSLQAVSKASSLNRQVDEKTWMQSLGCAAALLADERQAAAASRTYETPSIAETSATEEEYGRHLDDLFEEHLKRRWAGEDVSRDLQPTHAVSVSPIRPDSTEAVSSVWQASSTATALAEHEEASVGHSRTHRSARQVEYISAVLTCIVASAVMAFVLVLIKAGVPPLEVGLLLFSAGVAVGLILLLPGRTAPRFFAKVLHSIRLHSLR